VDPVPDPVHLRRSGSGNTGIKFKSNISEDLSAILAIDVQTDKYTQSSSNAFLSFTYCKGSIIPDSIS
jgi:hypothetical protein